MPLSQWSGLLAVVVMGVALAGLYYLVIKQNAVIGNKTIQFLAVAFVLPMLLALGTFNVLGRDTIGTLIGVIIGYALSNLGKE